jgi:hypothetical protein
MIDEYNLSQFYYHNEMTITIIEHILSSHHITYKLLP